jgi:hypothetical protein
VELLLCVEAAEMRDSEGNLPIHLTCFLHSQRQLSMELFQLILDQSLQMASQRTVPFVHVPHDGLTNEIADVDESVSSSSSEEEEDSFGLVPIELLESVYAQAVEEHEFAIAQHEHEGDPDALMSTMSMLPRPPDEASYNAVSDLLFAYYPCLGGSPEDDDARMARFVVLLVDAFFQNANAAAAASGDEEGASSSCSSSASSSLMLLLHHTNTPLHKVWTWM